MNPAARHRPVLLAVLLAAAMAVGGCTASVTSDGPGAAPSWTVQPTLGPTPSSGTARATVTFYGGPDNDPPGSTDIAHPNGRHTAAGGVGTAADPITLASDPRELPPGTAVYVPWLQKYFVMEDDCATCTDEWNKGHAHIDLWTAPAGAAVQACEQALTPEAPVLLEVNPPPGRPVDTRPLYNASTGACWPAT